MEIGKESLALFARNESLMMTYRRSNSLHIVGYSDSNYAGDDRKSMSGYVFALARGSYFMEKLKANHHYIVHNVCRFVACYEATGQVNWLKKFIPGFEGG